MSFLTASISIDSLSISDVNVFDNREILAGRAMYQCKLSDSFSGSKAKITVDLRNKLQVRNRKFLG